MREEQGGGLGAEPGFVRRSIHGRGAVDGIEAAAGIRGTHT
jgi:hypothetical protein